MRSKRIIPHDDLARNHVFLTQKSAKLSQGVGSYVHAVRIGTIGPFFAVIKDHGNGAFKNIHQIDGFLIQNRPSVGNTQKELVRHKEGGSLLCFFRLLRV